MSVLPAGSGASAVSVIFNQLKADLPVLSTILAGVLAIHYVLKLLRYWIDDDTPTRIGRQSDNPFASSNLGGNSNWRKFERDNERTIRRADEAIKENDRLMKLRGL
jgi:hypothetical protein